MSKISTGTIACPKCSHSQSVEVYSSINVKLDPELRDKFLEQNLNIFTCENCGLQQPISVDLMYHDMERGFIVYLVPSGNFEAKMAELNNMPSFGGIADYFKHPLFVKDYKEAMLMVHLCENNGAPKTDEERDKYYEAYKEISAIYEQADTAEYVLPYEPFEQLDAYNQEGYGWANEVFRICQPITGVRADLAPYALAMIVDDFIHIVIGYPKQEWDDVLDETFGNHEAVWEQVYAVRDEIFRVLKSKIGEDGIIESLEAITETVDPEEPDVTIITLTDTQRMELGNFVSNGLSY